MITSFATRITAFIHNHKGVAAVEFALIAPILLILYFMTIETVQGIETNRRLGRLGTMVADLVGQQDQLSASVLKDIIQITEATMRPYSRSTPEVTVSAIQIGSERQGAIPRIVWSGKVNSSGNYVKALAAGSTVSVPAVLKTGDSFLIRVESRLNYFPILLWPRDGNTAAGPSGFFTGLKMTEINYARPRIRREIACPTC
ncbi:TadE/TadG family type IV pilus assembly protein [Aquamicrobium segne]|uniref:TadE/TadG family type IV pilus assembly protein n=1 Tax=Aquamicrobium segne TaxID=469547 RepID=A0ABW0GXI4_9HYPH